MFFLQKLDPTEGQIRWIAILASLLFSLLVIAQDEVVNSDGAFYLGVTDLITQGEWRAAFEHYRWPFLPILISYTSQATGLMPEYAAYLLSMLFYVLLVVTFIDFIRQLGGDCRTQLLAAVVILTLPYLNESRSEILRGHGYWLFYLLGLRFLFKHYQTPHLKWGLAWNAAILTSCLFRVEGFVMMALLPFILLLKQETTLKQRFANFVQANWISLSLLIVGLVLLAFAGDNIGRLAEFPSRLALFWNAATVGLAQKAEVVRAGVLPSLSEKFAMPSVIAILVLITVAKTLSVMTSLHGVMLLLPRLHSAVVLPRGFRAFVVWVAFINLVVLLIFLVPYFFLQARYTMPLALTVLLLLPFLMNQAWGLWQQKSESWLYSRLFPVAMVIILLMGADGLISVGGYSKAYLRDSSEWVVQNSPAGSKIVTSVKRRFCYYVNRDLPFEQRYRCHKVAAPHAKMEFDYLTVIAKKGVIAEEWQAYLEQASLHEVARFENSRQDGMIVYQRENSRD